MDRIEALLKEYEPTMLEHWKWLHAHPELSGQEAGTAAYVAARLREMGLEPREQVGGHGVVALIEGAKPGRCLALRADMDALPIQEKSGLPFASQNPGVMHACGHDAHTAMLLGAAWVLNEMKNELCGSVKLIFQPSEETSDNSGAKRMIEDGVLEQPKVDAIIGQHVNPKRATGVVTTLEGAVSAASDRFFITIKGKASHAAKPNNGVDAIVIGAQVISALQTIVSRSISPVDSCVITIGTVSGGTRYNVIADTFRMEGTCRNLNPAVREALPERMEHIIRGITEGMGAEYEFRYVKGYDPILNDRSMYRLVYDTAVSLQGEENMVVPQQPMGGEDFSYFAAQVPAVFYRIGCHKEGTPEYPQHNERFVPDPDTLYYGARVMVKSAIRYLEQR
ncbi:MAG: amidohydrolase [Oscillospiraceae bacterium]|nr:amidohydrolase [Oscillospiraceae bacterium]